MWKFWPIPITNVKVEFCLKSLGPIFCICLSKWKVEFSIFAIAPVESKRSPHRVFGIPHVRIQRITQSVHPTMPTDQNTLTKCHSVAICWKARRYFWNRRYHCVEEWFFMPNRVKITKRSTRCQRRSWPNGEERRFISCVAFRAWVRNWAEATRGSE